MAIGDAVGTIRDGRADVMVAGGSEAPITPIGVGGFYAMRAISQRNDDPETASRPFDAGRDGFILSEGAAVLVLEELERARGRGARIYAEVLGYGMSSDAHHVTEPDPVGTNPARAMTMAMEDAGITPADIGYVNAHGTSTPAGDSAETRALKLALGDEHAARIPISSTKSETGHLLGATGAVEVAVTALAMRDGFLPPTINLTDPDPECDLDYIPNVGREADVRVAVSNSFGFGGHNAVMVLRRWDAGD
jgi:3-oxoacyl-[acyl-carrier-protein] synthase II